VNQQQDRGIIGELAAAADEQLNAAEPAEWGEEIDLAEGERFFGRFLGEDTSRLNGRTVFLLLAPEEGVTDLSKSTVPCFIRERTMLRSEFDRTRPTRGDFIVIARGEDREGRNGPYYTYAVATAPCSEPLPGPAGDVADLQGDGESGEDADNESDGGAHSDLPS
jgi:hypothetical protein